MSIFKRIVLGKRCILVLQIFVETISSDNWADVERSQLMPVSQFNGLSLSMYTKIEEAQIINWNPLSIFIAHNTKTMVTARNPPPGPCPNEISATIYELSFSYCNQIISSQETTIFVIISNITPLTLTLYIPCRWIIWTITHCQDQISCWDSCRSSPTSEKGWNFKSV